MEKNIENEMGTGGIWCLFALVDLQSQQMMWRAPKAMHAYICMCAMGVRTSGHVHVCVCSRSPQVRNLKAHD